MNRSLPKSWLMAVLVVVALIPQHTGARTSTVSSSNIRYGRTSSGYLYMTGGESAQEQFSMERSAAAYNVKLVLVPPPAIPLPQLRVYIANNRTGKIEKIPLSGPWLYFQLPAGSYTIGARIRNRLYLLRGVHVQDAQRQTHVLRADLLPWSGNQPKSQGVR